MTKNGKLTVRDVVIASGVMAVWVASMVALAVAIWTVATAQQ